ncbi:MAG: cinA [Clostridiales bacterium]|nr:cinA [Clostridiales bacterium]
MSDKAFKDEKENINEMNSANIEDIIGELLIKNKLTISTAESCTGGMVAARLINYPGISQVFMEGAVTYSNEAKMNRLGVSRKTLENFGAVSPETAGEMAWGIAKTSRTDIGISTTGIAGPGGGTHKKPVGLVYIGLCIKGRVMTQELRLDGDRQGIRISATIKLLNWLREELVNSFK